MGNVGRPVGSPAPRFSFKSFGSKRPIELQALVGEPVLLVFVNYATARQSRDVALAVQAIDPNLEQTTLINIVDLRIVPRLLRGVARTVLQSAVDQARADVPPGYDPDEFLILAADWEGKLTDAYRIPDSTGELALVLIDRKGIIAASYRGPEPATAAQNLLRPILTPGSSG